MWFIVVWNAECRPVANIEYVHDVVYDMWGEVGVAEQSIACR